MKTRRRTQSRFSCAKHATPSFVPSWFDSPAGRRRWRVAVCGPARSAAVELGPQFQTSFDPKGADFALMLGEFYCADINAPILVEIEREGVVYARVYDVRGQAVLGLVTIPPP